MQRAPGFAGHTEISPKKKLNSQSVSVREMCTAEPSVQEKKIIFFHAFCLQLYKEATRDMLKRNSIFALYRRLLTPRLPALCWASQAQLKFLAFIFLHCPCLPHKLPSPTWSRSARTVSAGLGRRKEAQRWRRGAPAQPRADAAPGAPRARPQQVTAPPPPLAGPRPAAAGRPCERQHFKRDYRPEPPLESEPAAF